MNYRRFTDPAEFYEYILPFLTQHEAENNLILGLAHEVKSPHSRYTEYYLASVEYAGNIVAVVLRTPPHNLLLSHMDTSNSDEILTLIAREVQTDFATLPGVIGNLPFADDFAKIWQAQTAQTYSTHMPQGLYQLREVFFPENIAGQMRAITEADRPLLEAWFRGFMLDALNEEPSREDIQNQVQRRLVGGDDTGLFIWEVDGEPVSMAGYSGPTPHGIRINAVYTPAVHRRHGYATACVAKLSQYLLDKGRKLCFLYTDLNNPTANRIYQKIGYQQVCNSAHILFTEA